jgi:hypothetical protein
MRRGALDVPDALRGGVQATFEVSGERFQVWVVNPQTIWDLYQLKTGREHCQHS